MDLHPSCQFSLSTRFDKVHPRGIHVGAETYLAFDVAVLSHEMIRAMYVDTRIGCRCFIGARSIIMPGVEIGDGCVVAAGSVVTRVCRRAASWEAILRESSAAISKQKRTGVYAMALSKDSFLSFEGERQALLSTIPSGTSCERCGPIARVVTVCSAARLTW